MANAAVCGKCHQVIEREHNGKSGITERTDPWVFVAHEFDDERGGQIFRTRCPGSGKNPWVTANAY
ncbi:hypothetical protein [Blastococcus sp. MG754427]|uniref:hypothetical protein n=1 Tax=unclassified Blastococcus TaxID=2619396 RepID=UPI001F168760|nr:hypothetical protein [Blastococcus sp. MG754427]MCF6512162.1 hypothetical protein [Blastococcus sp. MG754427]